MSRARYLIGDVFDTLATLPDDSVDLVFTSPPFLALRSYLPADHPDKAREIGSEATPAAFLDRLLDVVDACDRVLAPHGTLVFELGDTHAGSSGPMGDRGEVTGQGKRSRGDAHERSISYVRGTVASVPTKGPGWPLDKSLCMVPSLFAASLAYGRNLLRPERETPRWRVRNLIAWCRPNPPVGALGDKFRPATSYLTVACKSRNRYFDLDAVREESVREPRPNEVTGRRDRDRKDGQAHSTPHAGAPPLDFWVIPTEPYEGAHYATFPRALVVKPVKAMSPQRVCTVCGEPSRRIVETTHEPNRNTNGPQSIERKHLDGGSAGYAVRADRHVETLGWSDCGHDAWRNGVVLDPFAGSGTTLAVATGHGRDAIGIDIDERNAELALERVGPMFLTVEDLRGEGVA